MNSQRSSTLPVGAWDRVSGGATYVGDVRVPGALHVAFVHAPVPAARIAGIDPSAAWAVPDVVDIITAEDIGELLVGRALRDYPVLAAGEVRFAGQRVAAVAARTRAAAREAALLVDVDYDEEAGVLDLDAALAVGAAVHPGYDDYTGAVSDRPTPNAQGVWRSAHGDADAALAAADTVFDDVFTMGRSHAAPLEPHACIVSAGPERIDVWSTHKEPYNLRALLASVAGVAPETVRVHLAPIGGDFGSKGFAFAEVACYLLSARTGRPVRHTMSYDDELATTAARHPMRLRLRTAVTGRSLVALDARSELDGGAFGGVKAAPMVVVPVVHAPLASYAVPHRREVCTSYYSNTLPGGHVRSPGEFQAIFAAESQLDMIAARLGLDPLELRAGNAADDRVRRVVAELSTVVESWRATKAADSGIGVALTFRDTGPGSTTVRATARPSHVDVELAVADQGAGSYEMFRGRAAETLGVAPELVRIRPVAAGEDPALTDGGAGASRVTAVAGRAVTEACVDLLRVLGRPPDPAADDWVLGRVAELGGSPLVGLGSAEAQWPAAPGADLRSHGAVAVEVCVDTRTGAVDVLRGAVIADTGRVLNPVAHRGQIEGGFVYGLSQTLLEDLVVEAGIVTTVSLGDYKLASAADVPPLQVRVLPPHPGTGDVPLSVGELVNVGVAPAVANAVADATGARVRDLPITAERVLAALRVAGRGGPT
ncbi:xanthine dehydrogenase family protein molybdopterin-binding subunit [Pseudonocardia sp.]|uniref:xanthine dehydrogenase family protein molybdopterin-binding subunit n=1 Tax=Pseudonocardia sp. TaxID=60912 RepID=UPI003D0E34B9